MNMFNDSKNKINRSKKIRGAKPITKSTGLMIAVCAAIVLPALWTVGKAEDASKEGSVCSFDVSKTDRTPAWFACKKNSETKFWMSVFTTIQKNGKRKGKCSYSDSQLRMAEKYCQSRIGDSARLMGAFTETEAAQDSTFEKMQKNATTGADGSIKSEQDFSTMSVTSEGVTIPYKEYKTYTDYKNIASSRYYDSEEYWSCSFDESTLQKTPAWLSCKNPNNAGFWMSVFTSKPNCPINRHTSEPDCLQIEANDKCSYIPRLDAENYCQSIMGADARLSQPWTEAEAIKENPLLGKMQKNGTTNSDGSAGSDRIFAAVSVTGGGDIIPYRDYKDLKSSLYKHIFPKGKAHPLYGSQPKVSNSEIPNSGTTNGFTQKLCDFPSSLVKDPKEKIQPAYLACMTSKNPIKIKHAYAVQTFVRNGSQYCKVDEDQFEKAQEECKKNGGWVFPLAMTAKEFIAMEAFYPKEDPEKFKKFSKTLDLDDELIAPYIDPTTFQKV
jgi:hypothetical protein